MNNEEYEEVRQEAIFVKQLRKDIEKDHRIKELEDDLGNTERCEQAQIQRADKAEQKVRELEAALIEIYDSPSNTDTIIDIAYDALYGNV